MNELKLSKDINQIEFEIQHYKQVAGQSIWEIGRRLNHVKDHDLVHGEFNGWLKSIGLNYPEANRMMNVAKELPNLSTLKDLGSTALYLIATLPDEEKQEQLQKVEQGDSPTVKELRELKRQLKEREKDVEALKADYRMKEVEINQLKEQPPREVVPEDYERIKREIQELQSNNQSLSDQIKQMKSQREEEDRNSRKYRELTQSIQEMEGKMNRTQKLIATQKQVYELVDLSKELLTKITPIPYLVDAEFVRENEVAKRELMNIADQTNKFLDNLNEILKENRIIEGVIINE